MTKYYLTWYGKGENGEYGGCKLLIDIDSNELVNLGLLDNTYTPHQVRKLEQFKYLSQFINSSFWTDEYDYFVESFVGE